MYWLLKEFIKGKLHYLGSNFYDTVVKSKNEKKEKIDDVRRVKIDKSGWGSSQYWACYLIQSYKESVQRPLDVPCDRKESWSFLRARTRCVLRPLSSLSILGRPLS